MNNLRFLHGWRGLAITWIVLAHAISRMPGKYAPVQAYLVKNIYMVVDVFFLLFGFFLMRNVLGRRNETALGFLRKKAVRLLPLYAALVACIVAIGMFDGFFSYVVKNTIVADRLFLLRELYSSETATLSLADNPGRAGRGELTLANREKLIVSLPEDAASSLRQGGIVRLAMRPTVKETLGYFTFTENIFFPDGRELTSHLWFHSFIVHSCLVAALAIFVLNRTRVNLGENAFIAFLIAFVIFENVLRYNVGVEIFRFHKMTFFRLDSVAVGGLLYLLSLKLRGIRDAYLRPLLVLSFFAGLGIFTYLTLTPDFYENGIARHPFSITAHCAAFGLMILGTFDGTLLRRVVLENRLVVLLGQASFGIYIVHLPLVYILIRMQKAYAPGLSYDLLVLLIFGVSVAVGISAENVFSGQWLKPAAAAIRRRLGRETA